MDLFAEIGSTSDTIRPEIVKDKENDGISLYVVGPSPGNEILHSALLNTDEQQYHSYSMDVWEN